ncbi:ubiquitin carboxyl-terminal hydrolase 44-like [Lampetra fluviatilis]
MDKCRHVFRLRLAQDHSIMNPQKWLCAECGTTESVWACLGCSHVACGRYISEHALLHYQNTGHPLALEVNELHVYCYACDDYVLNDNATGDLRLLRSTLSAVTSQRYQLTTRSGRTLRSGTSDDARPSERRVEAQLRAEDRMFTALWHRRLALARKVFAAWAGLTVSGRRRALHESDTAQEQRRREDAQRERQERRRRHREEMSSRPPRKSPRLSNVMQHRNHRAPAPTPAALPPRTGEAVAMAMLLTPLPPSPAPALPPDAPSPPLKRRPTVTPGVTGLRNLGNTCYMNSILQVLSHLQAFRQCFLLLDLSGAGSDPGATSWPLEGDDPTGPRRQRRHAGLARQLSEQCYREATGLGQAAATVTDSARRESRRAGLSGGGGAERVTHGQQHQVHGQQQQQREEEEEEERVSLCHELHTLFRVMWSGKWALVSPYAMLHSVWRLVPSFKGYAQQDAQEFLCELLDKVLQELEAAAAAAASSSSAGPGSPVSPVSPVLPWPPGPPHANAAPVSPFPRLPPSPLSQRKLVRQVLRVVASIFQGELLSQVTCLSCAHTSRRNELFWDLSLDFPERYHGLVKAVESDGGGSSGCGTGGSGAGGSTNGGCTLTEMLAKFTETEALDGGKVYSCDTCNSRRRRSSSKQPILTEAQKQLLVHRLPRVLRLHLKRFRWSGRNHREKIGVHVAFEQRLCMTPYCSHDGGGGGGGGGGADPSTYDLSAVVMHHGRGFGSGHYTAYCYNAEGGFWVHCNDSRLDVVSVAEVCRAQAYILFYTRCRAGGPQAPACPSSIPAMSPHAPPNRATNTAGRRRRRRLDLS